MKNSRLNTKIRCEKGFTLLELLVVVAIIGLLAGLLFPAATGALRRAEKTHAENTCYQLKNSISAYFTEYRKYPVDPDETEESEFETDNSLMDVLLGSESEGQRGGLNPRRIAFYTGKKAKPMGDGKYRKGIRLESGGAGQLWDPWGNFYLVKMDLDYNSRIEAPDGDSSDEIPESILVWSLGKPEGEVDESDAITVKTW